jgi:hypothetical protein
MKTVASERAMRSINEMVRRVRGWRLWEKLGLVRSVREAPFLILASRPLLREVTPNGVRVYALCNSCGTVLAASATLCSSCASKRSPSHRTPR